MLVLSRRPGESIILDNRIKIIYLGKGRFDHGKIGIEAPFDVSIHREEIQERINNGEEYDKKKESF